jgi:predicted Zn-dependent protease with MMP-like domain
MNQAKRDRFDQIVEDAFEALPRHVRRLLDEVPLVVLDKPSSDMLKDLGMTAAEADELCGLHTGTANTERSVELSGGSGDLPSHIHLFRSGIVALVGGWDAPHADEEIYEQIRITLLHEIGHQFGLGEDDLADLGYD